MEGAKINRSLLALANCINALGDKNKKGFFVPYRVRICFKLGFKIDKTTQRLSWRKLQNSHDCEYQSFWKSVLVNCKHFEIRQQSKEYKNQGNY